MADGRIDPYAYDAVPWIVFFLTFCVGGIGLVLRSGAQCRVTCWQDLPLLIWLVLFVWFRPGRRGRRAPPRRVPFSAQIPIGGVNDLAPQRSTASLREWLGWQHPQARALSPTARRADRWWPWTFVGVALLPVLLGRLRLVRHLPHPLVSRPS